MTSNTLIVLCLLLNFTALLGQDVYGVAVDRSGVFQYRSSSGSWKRIGIAGAHYATANGKLYGLSPDKSAVWEYQNAPYRWKKIHGPADTIISGDELLILPVDSITGKTKLSYVVYNRAGSLSRCYVRKNFPVYSGPRSVTCIGMLDGPGITTHYGGDVVYTLAKSNMRELTQFVHTSKDQLTWATEKGIFQTIGNTHDEFRKIGGPGAKFVMANDRIYGLTPSKKSVWEYQDSPNQWKKVFGPAENIYGGEVLLLVDPATKDIHQYLGTNHSKRIGGPGANFLQTGF